MSRPERCDLPTTGRGDARIPLACWAVLREAHEYALEFRLSPWDFPVEIDDLRATGIHYNDLRWLFCAGYVEHLEEVASHSEQGRHGLSKF